MALDIPKWAMQEISSPAISFPQSSPLLSKTSKAECKPPAQTLTPILNSISTLVTRLYCVKNRTILGTFFAQVRSATGKVSKSIGTGRSIRISSANPKIIGLFWLSHQWTLQRIGSKLLRSCLRHSMSRASLLACRLLLLCTHRLLRLMIPIRVSSKALN